MANHEQLVLLRKGVDAWNAWRKENPDVRVDLINANLAKANLSGVNLKEANLHETNFSGADLRGAVLDSVKFGMTNFSKADLSGASLRGADFQLVNFTGANLSGALLQKSELTGGRFEGANLTGADLIDAKLLSANLDGAYLRGAHFGDANLASANIGKADFSEATLIGTIFGTVDLSRAIGLDQCVHLGPSVIDFATLATLQKSDPLPLTFLRGIGLPDTLIEYLPSLLNQPIQFYSCFISYSSKDQEFAERLHADLQNKGVRCWFAPHDMPIGAKIIDALDEAIRLRDKVLLILSENAIASDWVEGEVTRALDEERTRKQVVLFPVRIDDAVMQTSEAWARLLRGQRNIGDFTRWKDHDAYQKSFERVLRDLKVNQASE